MSSEYVKLSRPEVVFGEKNLLQSQIDILNVAKRFNEYKKLRREDLILKIELKNKLDEIRNSFLLLNKLLPKTKGIPEEKEYLLFKKERNSLEDEIELIRRKLAKLK